MLKMLSLFSGIGGFDIAARWTGQIETVAFVEIDPFCQKVLKKHWPTVPIISDIREVTGERIREIVTHSIRQGAGGICGTPCDQRRGTGEDRGEGIRQENGEIGTGGAASADRNAVADTESDRRQSFRPEPEGQQRKPSLSDGGIDILTGGFPCQPFSCAGKRKGTDDNRFLWPEMLRVIKEVRPRWVIGENVAGLISIDNGMVFEDCCTSLEAEGYAVQSFILPACSVGAPHRRDRVWIVAHSINGRSQERWTGNVTKMDGSREKGGKTRYVSTEIEESDSHAPDTEHTTPSRHGQDGRGILPVAESIRPDNGNQWAEDWYSVALRTCVRTLDDGVSGKLAGRHRVSKLKALGNAIVPQVAYEILKAIVEIEKEAK